MQSRTIIAPSPAEAQRSGPARLVMALLLGMSLALGQVTQAAAQAAPDSFADLAEQISPAVVNITTTTITIN